MVALIGISGSLRKGSFNSALLRAAVPLMPAGSTLSEGTIRGIPLYDGDAEEASGVPEPVQILKDAVAASDGLLLVTPEYNGSIPGVFKNAIDWMSRPSSEIARVFAGRPVALAGASLGGFGTLLSQTAWLQVLRKLGAEPWTGEQLTVARANALFAEDGTLADRATADQLRKFLADFSEYCARAKTARGG